MLFIARPELMVEERQVMNVLQAALDPAAPYGLKSRALANLTELLRAEEDGLMLRQRSVSYWAASGCMCSDLLGTIVVHDRS